MPWLTYLAWYWTSLWSCTFRQVSCSHSLTLIDISDWKMFSSCCCHRCIWVLLMSCREWTMLICWRHLHWTVKLMLRSLRMMASSMSMLRKSWRRNWVKRSWIWLVIRTFNEVFDRILKVSWNKGLKLSFWIFFFVLFFWKFFYLFFFLSLFLLNFDLNISFFHFLDILFFLTFLFTMKEVKFFLSLFFLYFWNL